MPLSQRLQVCATTKKGARGQIRTQPSSFSRWDRPDVDAQTAGCHRKRFESIEGVVTEGAVIESG